MRVRRRAAAIAFGGLLFVGLPTGMLGIAWPTMRVSLDAPLAGLGLLVSAMTVATFAASGLSGFVRERLGTIALLLAAALTSASGLALFALASGWLATIVAALILGLGIGLLDAAANTEAALRGDLRFMGAIHGAWAIGAALGPPLVGAMLVVGDSWRPAYALAAGAFAGLALAIWLIRRDLDAAPEIAAEAPGDRPVGRTVLLGCALMFVYVGVEVGAGQWSYTRLVSDGALSDALAGAAVFLYWSALAAGRIALALFGDRVAPERLFDLSVFGAVASTVAFSVLPPIAGAAVALPCLGLALSVFVPVLVYLTPRRIGAAASARAIGYLMAAGMIGGAALPAAVGLVMQTVAVSALGPCLVALTVFLAALHVVSSRTAPTGTYVRASS